ncbi:MAG: nucleotide exchange factor GrpE [Bacteroidia bacterium]|nr:nucleotide exchange factor GrpE [Bacteroidia bacterium]
MAEKETKEAKEKKDKAEMPENHTGFDINTDENISGTSHLNDPVADEPEIEKLREELAGLKDKNLRLVAEFDNFRKRNAKERIELIQTAGRDVITELLTVLDDCERAEKQLTASEEATEVKEGVQLVFNKLRNTLTNRGLRPMESIHADFNPDLHEAITEVEAPSADLKGKIIDEVQKGYYLNDKIIRHAKVVVGK